MKIRISVSGAAGMLMLAPLAADAQVVIRQVTPRTSNTADGNMCLQLPTGPSRLASSPEGQMIIRMRAEIEAVERSLSADTSARRQFVVVKGSLDTVERILVGGADPMTSRFFFENRSGAPVVVEGQRVDPSDPQRMMVISKLRELQPQVAELRRASPQGFVGNVTITIPTLGYIGVSATAGTFPTSIDPMLPFAYCEYPRVESVEPGSPADKAGLLAGDTLIAYNGRDLQKTNVNYPELLVPGKSLSIRYRRDGRVQNTTMTVAARDSEHTRMLASFSACSEAEAAAGCRSEQVVVRGISGGLSPITSGAISSNGAAVPARRGAVAVGSVASRPVTGVPAPATRTALLVLDNSGGVRFAGALLRAFDEETARNLGLEPGLRVVDMPPTVPAFDAGLRGGDWIMSANGVAVRTVDAFVKVFQEKFNQHQMVLQVTSKAEGQRTVTIKW